MGEVSRGNITSREFHARAAVCLELLSIPRTAIAITSAITPANRDILPTCLGRGLPASQHSPCWPHTSSCSLPLSTVNG